MSLFLNYVSAIINITAKVASLLFTVSGSTDHRLTSFLVTAQSMNMVP